MIQVNGMKSNCYIISPDWSNISSRHAKLSFGNALQCGYMEVEKRDGILSIPVRFESVSDKISGSIVNVSLHVFKTTTVYSELVPLVENSQRMKLHSVKIGKIEFMTALHSVKITNKRLTAVYQDIATNSPVEQNVLIDSNTTYGTLPEVTYNSENIAPEEKIYKRRRMTKNPNQSSHLEEELPFYAKRPLVLSDGIRSETTVKSNLLITNGSQMAVQSKTWNEQGNIASIGQEATHILMNIATSKDQIDS